MVGNCNVFWGALAGAKFRRASLPHAAHQYGCAAWGLRLVAHSVRCRFAASVNYSLWEQSIWEKLVLRLREREHLKTECFYEACNPLAFPEE